MRQDLRQRQKHIRKLHESIEKYQQSPNTKKAVEQATIELANAIEYKYKKSAANQNYIFPRNQPLSDDEFDAAEEVVDLRIQPDFLSQDMSVAEEPQSNVVYASEKTVMMQDKYSPFCKSRPDAKSKLKIKVIKKKNPQVYQTSKLDRLKTEHIHVNFSTVSYKNETNSKSRQNQSTTTSKSRLIAHPLNLDSNGIRKKLKIATRIDTEQTSSPFHGNLTMKTEYVDCTKRKVGKQNQRSTLNPHQDDKYYLGHHQSTKKLQPTNYKLFLNIRSSIKKHKQAQCSQNPIKQLKQTKESGKKNVHKSFENLKSIRLGHNKSSEKMKMKKIKGLHA